MQSSDTNLIRSTGAGSRRIYYQYFVLVSFLVVCTCMYGLSGIDGFTFYPDEFGYWASAARNVGYDWTEVASLGSYYSFGYSLILTPILLVFKGGLAAYRAAVVVNMLLQVASIWLMWGIARRLYPQSRDMNVIYAVSIAALYPVWTFFVQTTLAEGMIYFLYILVCYFFVLIFEKPRVITVIGLLLSLIYMLSVHMRTVGVVIAAVIVFIIWALSVPKYRKYIILMIVVLGLGVVAFGIYKAIITSNVYKYTDAGTLSSNMLSGQLWIIDYLLTREGIIGFFAGLLSKIYYLGLSSYGLFYIAAYECIKKSIIMLKALLKGNSKKVAECIFYTFLILSTTGQVLITTLYMIRPKGYQEVFYGRYNEYVLPIFIMVGVLELIKSRKWIAKYITIFLLLLAQTFVGYSYCKSLDIDVMHEFFVAAMSYLWDGGSFELLRDICTSCAFSLAITFLVMVCILACKEKHIRHMFLNIVLVMEIVLGLVLCTKNVYLSSKIDRNDLQVYRYLSTIVEDEDVVYLKDNNNTYVDLIQFYLQDKSIHVTMEPNEIPNNAYLIVDNESEKHDEILKSYKLIIETAWFRLYST